MSTKGSDNISPRSKEQNEEIRRQRTLEILHAAVQVYAEKGYAGSDIGEIAERAGMARALVYHYFKDKQTLFRQLHEYMMYKSQRFTVDHYQQKLPVLDLFREYAKIVCMRVLNDPAVSRFYTRISLDLPYLYTDQQFSSFEWVKDFLQPMSHAIETGIEDGSFRRGNVSLMAMQFWGAVSQGMHYMDQLHQELVSKGASKTEIEMELTKVLEQVIDSSLSVLKYN